MNLLYCKNGVVLGWHDSLQAPVEASRYGDGVRVIPYPNPVAQLERIGDPPADRARDTRSYAEPPPTPELLRTFAGQVRFDTVTAGITWNGIPVKTDRISQLLIGNLASYAATMQPPTATINFTQDGTAHQFTAQQTRDLNNTVNEFLQSCRTVEAECLADLSSATPTLLTYEDVEARFAALNATTLAAKRT